MNGIEIKRHSLSHILAQAIQREIDADIKLGVGPAIANGFYYDVYGATIKEENINNLQSQVEKIIKEGQKIIKIDTNYELAIEINEFLNQEFKIEMINELVNEGEKNFSFYLNTINIDAKEGLLKGLSQSYQSKYEKINNFLEDKGIKIEGEYIVFIDICKGPHVENTNVIDNKGVKIAKLAGAYWKGDENNIMMQRVYGYAFDTKEELKEYINFLEDAKKRDHRILGQQLDLFCFSDLVGPGLPLFTPKGTLLKELLQNKIEKICRGYGFKKVMTPHLAKIDLYNISGHATKFADELFHVTSEKKHELVMKPVQCPHQTQIFASRPRSYKELPIRYMESEKQYRAEKKGEVGGLSRVYAITVEDGHSFCTIDQIKQEVINMVNIIKEFYTPLGLRGKHWVSLSVRDYENMDKYIGTLQDWDKAETMLEEISNELGLNAVKCEGEAALYGPKLDFMFKDALGREIQIPTVQLDFATPQRFKLKYSDENGNDTAPVMIHRAILGSYERLIMLLIEHFAGAFPVWLSPVQVKIIPVVSKFVEGARLFQKKLEDNGIRVEIDTTDHSLNKKIRNAELEKSPYIVIIGEKEIENGILSIREYSTKLQFEMSVDELITKIKQLENNQQ
ncbi:MAG: threonine--tRNA ligase [Candidatus Absconditabacteria bacterium]